MCWRRPVRRRGTAASPHLDPERLTVAFDGVAVFERGRPTGATPELGGSAVAVELDLGLGSGRASYLASDLTYDYVRLNAEYTT